MSQERKSFTVSDRRHFTSEGEPRREEEEAVSPAPAAEAGDAAEAATRDVRESPEPGFEPPAADFMSFLLSLAAQAGAALSDQAEPQAALRSARYLISILEMLEDKTRGRRTPEEDEVLSGLLYELRMAYVARTRAGGA
jgi:hypothetical protein